MAKTFKSTEVVAQKKTAQFDKSQTIILTQKIYARTHTTHHTPQTPDSSHEPEDISAGSQPPTMQQDK